MHSSNSLLIHKIDTLAEFSTEIFEQNISEVIVGKIDKKLLAIKGLNGECVKKREICDKNLFQITLNEVVRQSHLQI